MRVVLFYPRGYDSATVDQRVFCLASALPPLGLASIAAVLRQEGHLVHILDGNLFVRVTNRRWAQRIAALEPDYVGFSTTTSSFLDAYDVCRLVKQLRESAQTVFGGVHVSSQRAAILDRFEAVDYVLAGEGETSLLKLVNGEDHSTIEGLYYRNGKDIQSGPDPKTLCRMDDLPFPACDLLDGFPAKYVLPLFSYPRSPGTSVISSRGCVYQCGYCDRSVFGKSFRWNSPEYTFDLVTWLRKDFGVRHVNFYDDLFTLNRGRVARLCELFRSRRPGVTFNCIVRTGHVDMELIRELKSAGCWMVNVGIESGDQRILDSQKEGLRLEDIRRDVELLHNEGLWVKGLFMIGSPGETEQSIKKTIEFALSLPLKDINVTAFTPFPGAPVYSDIRSLGELDDDWSRMDCITFVFVPNGIKSRETLEKYYGDFIRQFYHRPFARRTYRKMFLQSPHSYWRLVKHAATFRRYARNLGSSRPAT